jgi:hypothetical protein
MDAHRNPCESFQAAKRCRTENRTADWINVETAANRGANAAGTDFLFFSFKIMITISNSLARDW